MASCSIILHKFFFYLIDKQKSLKIQKGSLAAVNRSRIDNISTKKTTQNTNDIGRRTPLKAEWTHVFRKS
jgi:hypothetical protein